MTQFLYETFPSFVQGIKAAGIKDSLPDCVVNGLNPRFELREYQRDALERFMHYTDRYSEKTPPTHLLFNMATGSGKTLVMAGLILYLYTRGYRNFLFFVNTTNIIGKTKDNFLNEHSAKYLFNEDINIEGQVVNVREVKNLEVADSDNINICFTTIQKLHGDLHEEKENCLIFDDFKDKKIVLLSDEAHHMLASTKQKSLSEGLEKPSWENTVEKILAQNAKENVLLEFTATMDFTNPNIRERYYPKAICHYDLKEFCNDGYSKDVHILQSDFHNEQRMLQAIIISQYRQAAAGAEKIDLKPVILFKSSKIEESKKNQEAFDALIDRLTVADIRGIRKQSNAEPLKRALEFFKKNDTLDSVLVKTLKARFCPKYCLNVNDEQELIARQHILNSLEDSDNQMRAIFAVNKLNEGWDVLNLFDIVRLHKTRGKLGKTKATTTSEAQLIGRGARYFPFAYGEKEKFYKRKFDDNLKHPLRILEELHYHSFKDVAYISDLKKALKEKGLYDDDQIDAPLFLKQEFKKEKLYKSGVIYLNERTDNQNEAVDSLAGLGVAECSVKHAIATGFSTDEAVLAEDAYQLDQTNGEQRRDISLCDIAPHIVRKAMAKNRFYDLDNLKKYFPKVRAARDFVKSKKYLGGLEIIFTGRRQDVDNLTNRDMLAAVESLLIRLEGEIKANAAEHKGTILFKQHKFADTFIDKTIRLKKGSERANGQEDFLSDKEWYVFNANYGTSEEKKLVEMMSGQIETLRKEHKEVYLVRNEQHFKIYDFKDGAGYAPDFVLFLQQKGGKSISYQIFIEPKGKHLREYDKWKERFLQAMEGKHSPIFLGESREYKIIGLPFYNSNDSENKFKDNLHSALERHKKKGNKKAGIDSPS